MSFSQWVVLPALTLAILILAPILAIVLGADAGDVLAITHDSEVVMAVFVSVGAAAAAVALGLVLGVPTGYLLARRQTRLTALLESMLDLSVVIPHPIIGIGLLLVFGRHRLVGSALRRGFGIEVASAYPGIVLAMLLVSVPFIIKAAREGFLAVPAPLERAARSLGATEGATFRRVGLPLAWPNIRAGALLAWARSVSEFGSVVVIAYYPRTAPVLIWDRFSAYGLKAALAPATLLLLVCLCIFFLLQVGGHRRSSQRERAR